VRCTSQRRSGKDERQRFYSRACALKRAGASATWADAQLLERFTGYRPQTDVRDGIARFVDWFRDYYDA
jgi:nucleoside-diphosphate-sugar epimerase